MRREKGCGCAEQREEEIKKEERGEEKENPSRKRRGKRSVHPSFGFNPHSLWKEAQVRFAVIFICYSEYYRNKNKGSLKKVPSDSVSISALTPEFGFLTAPSLSHEGYLLCLLFLTSFAPAPEPTSIRRCSSLSQIFDVVETEFEESSGVLLLGHCTQQGGRQKRGTMVTRDKTCPGAEAISIEPTSVDRLGFLRGILGSEEAQQHGPKLRTLDACRSAKSQGNQGEWERGELHCLPRPARTEGSTFINIPAGDCSEGSSAAGSAGEEAEATSPFGARDTAGFRISLPLNQTGFCQFASLTFGNCGVSNSKGRAGRGGEGKESLRARHTDLRRWREKRTTLLNQRSNCSGVIPSSCWIEAFPSSLAAFSSS